MVLYINCCPREDSRTDHLARALLAKLGPYEECFLYDEPLQPLNRESLDYRSSLIEKRDYTNPLFAYARQFAQSDKIVIAAPYWDLSFPAQLKNYIENIYVTGIVSQYDQKGMPQGLCKADTLYYVTTAGGPYDPRFSYDYIRTMAVEFFGIKETQLLKAEMLDVNGYDPEKILEETMKHYGLDG